MTRISDRTRDRLIKQLRKKWEIGFDRELTRDVALTVGPEFEIDDLDFGVLGAEFAMLAKPVVEAWGEIVQHSDIELRFKVSSRPARLGTCALLRDDLEPLNIEFCVDAVKWDADRAWPAYKRIVERLSPDLQVAQEDRLCERAHLIHSEQIRRNGLNADYDARMAPRERGDQGYRLYELSSQANVEHTCIEELRAIIRGKRGGVGEPYKGPVIPE